MEKVFKVFLLSLMVQVAITIPTQSGDDLMAHLDFNRGDFKEIVQPENLTPTEAPLILTNDGESCECVPYWRCKLENSSATTQSHKFFGEVNVRFTPGSCQDVLDVCCPADRTEPDTNTQEEILFEGGSECGIRNVNGIDFLMTGNFQNEAGFGELPWTVALLNGTNSICGGSLIHPSIVLTAAHCVSGISASQLKIRAGEWDTQTTKERLQHQERDVRKVVIHPGFYNKSLVNDIALLILDLSVRLDKHINIVCLPPADYFSTSPSCYASGWGKDVFGKRGKYSVIMKKVELPMVPSRTCEKTLRTTLLGRKFNLHSSFVCAGGQEWIDMCEGDGGSPLVCPYGPSKDNRYIQIGIVSWGVQCRDAIPGVYTNIPMFRKWIDKEVQDNGFDSSIYSYE